MRIALTGSNGLIGAALVRDFEYKGYEITRLVRSEAPAGVRQVRWDPATGVSDVAQLEGVDAVIHLAGENLAAGRWSAARKDQIRQSRVQGTQMISKALSQLREPPVVFLSASAVGFYGSQGDAVLTEESKAGTGFLAETCSEWENATQSAASAGVRVAFLRFGIVLSGQGGALPKMLPLFKIGLGGRLGNGRQFWSWIALPDVVDAVGFVLNCPQISGPVNLVAPNPVTNREFTAVLGECLRRPTFLPAPAIALRLGLGQMADEALLASARVMPAKLAAQGFRFRYPDLTRALSWSLR